jgi:hypothetical protein
MRVVPKIRKCVMMVTRKRVIVVTPTCCNLPETAEQHVTRRLVLTAGEWVRPGTRKRTILVRTAGGGFPKVADQCVTQHLDLVAGNEGRPEIRKHDAWQRRQRRVEEKEQRGTSRG